MDEQELLGLAHAVISWADQCYSGIQQAPGGQHYWPKRQKYMLARVRFYANKRPLTPSEIGGCCCAEKLHHGPGVRKKECPYHLAAELQPWNHRIPWNCPNYYDGCNCPGGPYFEPEVIAGS